MATLTVGGVDVPVQSATELEPLEVGDRVENFQGGLLTTVDARKRRWRVTTNEMDPSTFTTVRNALEVNPPISCSGDLIIGGPINCAAKILDTDHLTNAGFISRRLSFSLFEE